MVHACVKITVIRRGVDIMPSACWSIFTSLYLVPCILKQKLQFFAFKRQKAVPNCGMNASLEVMKFQK
jgi:hypothetical protein